MDNNINWIEIECSTITRQAIRALCVRRFSDTPSAGDYSGARASAAVPCRILPGPQRPPPVMDPNYIPGFLSRNIGQRAGGVHYRHQPVRRQGGPAAGGGRQFLCAGGFISKDHICATCTRSNL